MPYNSVNMPGYGDHVTWGPINWKVGHDPRLPDYNEPYEEENEDELLCTD